MSDDTLSAESTAEPEEDPPWAFKRFPMMEREMAIKAARRRKMTVPDYVAEAIRAHIESERDETGVFDVFPPGREIATTNGHAPETPPLTVEQIGEAVDIMFKIAERTGQKLTARNPLLKSVRSALAVRMR